MRKTDTEYYTNYYSDALENAYLGEKLKDSSRMLVFTDWIRSQVKAGGKILDIGCGDAIFAELMPEYDWYGIDINTEKAIKRIKPENLHNVDLMKDRYPFDDKSFDCIITSEVLEHVWDLRVVHKEAKRLLKREGIYIVSTPNFQWLQNHLEHFQRLRSQFEQPWTIEHIRHYDYEIHKKYLNECGFIIEKHTGADAHYDPITATISRTIRDRLRENGVEISEFKLHQWCGEALPHYAHTIILQSKKA